MNKEIHKELYQRSDTEIKSLDLFHQGQDAALNGDLETALDKINQSLEIAKDDNNSEWTSYLEATIAYLNGDLDKLKSLVDKAGNNIEVLSRLVKGLELRGIPNYKEDYSN